jgi:hypothetical protein
MDYPSHKSRSKKKSRDESGGVDGPELKLATYSAPFGEELPWRTAISDLPEFADASREWRPERGRLH